MVNNLNLNIYAIMLLFALASFISIAVGNIFLGIATLLFFVYVYRNKSSLYNAYQQYHGYFNVIALFITAMLLSALFSGNIKLGLKEWADMWIWRMMPFIIIVTVINECKQAFNILKAACLGVCIGIVCLIYQGISGDNRATGFFGHPMTFAGWLCLFLPIFFIGAFDNFLDKKYKIASLALLILGGMALIFNGTRGGWLAVAITLSLLLIHYMMRSKRNLIIGILLVSVCSGILYNNDNFMHRVSTITNNKYQSNSERLLMWNSAWNMFKDHPVLGVGLGQYTDNYQQKYISPKAKEPNLKHAHSNFMQMLAENGIIGFFSFVIMFGYIIINNLKKYMHNKNPYSIIIAAMSLSLLLQGVTEFNFGNSAVVKVYWLLLGCCLVLMNYYNKKEIH